MVFVSCTKQELPKEIVKSVGGGGINMNLVYWVNLFDKSFLCQVRKLIIPKY